MVAKKVTFQSKESSLIKKLYNKSFPRQERIPFWLLILRANAKWIDFQAFYDREQFCGFACLTNSEHLTNILYLAVDPQLRSKGYGSKILQFIQNQYKHHTIVLEIERVDYTSANYKQRKMRKDFYLRNSFMESGYGVTINGVKYEVLKNKKTFEQKDWCKLSSRLMFGMIKIKMYPIN